MVNKKEDAIKDYLAMTKQSWTWSKLTEEEKSFIQTQIDLFLKNKRGDENDI